MANKTLQILIDAKYKGSPAFKQAKSDAESLEKGAQKAGTSIKSSFSGVGAVLAGVGVAFGAVALAAKGAWNTLQEGAALELARSRFENLAESINTTADSMLSKMREATGGMMSDAQLMASGTDIISLGLAKTEEDAVRLASVIGQLGWDMQQVILTMANNSTMRLDALGLSMEDVKARAAALEAAGMSMDAAFDLAVIEAGEAKIEKLGSAADTTAGKIQQLQTAVENTSNAFKEGFSRELVEQMEDISVAAAGIGPALVAAGGGAGALAGQLTGLLAGGLFTNPTFLKLLELGLEQSTPQTGGAGSAWHQYEVMTGTALNGMEQALDAYRYVLGETDTELRSTGTSLSEWTDEAKKAAIASAEMAGELSGLDLSSIAGATQSGIWAVAGAHIQGMLDEAQAKADEVAAEIERAFRDAQLGIASGFSDAITALQDVEMPDMFNMDGAADMDMVATAIYNAGQAAGGTAGELAGLGVALGEFTPAMAEAALKAMLFQGALEGLAKEWKLGNLSTADFIASVQDVVTQLETNTVVDLQYNLVDKADGVQTIRVPVEPEWIEGDPVANAARPLRVPVEYTVAEGALANAVELVGLPEGGIEQEVIFTPDSAAVTEAITTISTDIAAIDGTVTMEPLADTVYAEIDAIGMGIAGIPGTVTMTPEAGAVNNEINRLTGMRIPVYVDFIPTGAVPTGSGGGTATSGTGRALHDKPAATFNMNTTISGVSDTNGVKRAVENSLREFYIDLQRAGVYR